MVAIRVVTVKFVVVAAFVTIIVAVVAAAVTLVARAVAVTGNLSVVGSKTGCWLGHLSGRGWFVHTASGNAATRGGNCNATALKQLFGPVVFH